MSFYLDMLREQDEFMGNTDFDPDVVATPDDKYEVELNDVSKIVDDINADYADQSSQEELDGQDLNCDPVSECMVAIYESEHNWNMIMQAIGSRELLEASRGRDMVMEAVDVKGFIDKAKQFFVRLWKKITAIVKNWIDNAMATFRTNKSFVNKYGSKLGDGKTAYEKANGKSFKGYKFNTDHDIATIISAQQKANKDFESGLRALIRGEDGVVGSNMSADNFRSALCGKVGGSVSAGDYHEALKNAYFGSTEKVTLDGKWIEAGYLKEVLSRSDKDVKDIKKAYGDMKTSFDKVLKALGELEKKLNSKKDSYDADHATNMTQVTKWISNEREMKKAGSMSLTMVMKCLRAEKAQARKIANAYIYALNKGVSKDKREKAGKLFGESSFFGALEMI